MNSSVALPIVKNDSISKISKNLLKFGPLIKSIPCWIPSSLLLYLSIKVTFLPFSEMKVSHLYGLSKKINLIPSLYLEAGAIHGTVLCHQNEPLVYMEDVGRHNAVDKIAGWIYSHDKLVNDKALYTTGRLTSEMVIKCALMGIPVLISRSGFTAWGVEIANQVGLTLIGRLRGKRFMCLGGKDRLIYDVE